MRWRQPGDRLVTGAKVTTKRAQAQPQHGHDARRITFWCGLRSHWPEYLYEALALGLFMVSACVFASILQYSDSPLRAAIASDLLRRMLMGIAMGATAIVLIY